MIKIVRFFKEKEEKYYSSNNIQFRFKNIFNTSFSQCTTINTCIQTKEQLYCISCKDKCCCFFSWFLFNNFLLLSCMHMHAYFIKTLYFYAKKKLISCLKQVYHFNLYNMYFTNHTNLLHTFTCTYFTSVTFTNFS